MLKLEDIRAEVAELADAQDLGTVRATLRVVTQHSEPERSTAKLASIHAVSVSFSLRRVRAALRSLAQQTEEPTDTTTDTNFSVKK
jgi:hypothetical protein